jgi:hypothetical protein
MYMEWYGTIWSYMAQNGTGYCPRYGTYSVLYGMYMEWYGTIWNYMAKHGTGYGPLGGVRLWVAMVPWGGSQKSLEFLTKLCSHLAATG